MVKTRARYTRLPVHVLIEHLKMWLKLSGHANFEDALDVYAALGFRDEDWHVLETKEQYISLLNFDGYRTHTSVSSGLRF